MARLQNKNNMRYHVFEQLENGYRLVKSYANESSMRRAMKPDQPRWIVWTRQVTLDNFSAIGMPNGYFWDGYNFVEKNMPVLHLL